jgi:hypothetical protein
MKKSYWATMLLAVLSIACDEMASDVIPSDEKLKQAANIKTALNVNGPVVINLVQESNFTGDATIKITKQPEKGTITILSTALIRYTPNSNFNTGEDNAAYSVCVGGDCDEAILQFIFTDPSNPRACAPVTVFDEVSANQGTKQIVAHILENDINCGSRFNVAGLSIIEAPKHGEAVATDGLIMYYPNDGFIGTDELTYRIATESNPNYYYYGVLSVNIEEDPIPVFTAVDDHFVYTQAEFNAKINPGYNSIDYSFNDIIGNDILAGAQPNQLEVSVTMPEKGNLTYYSLEMFRYTPGGNFDGEDQFTYTICANGMCKQATVMITVTDWSTPLALKANADTFYYTKAQYLALIEGGYHSLDYTFNQIIGNDHLGDTQPNQLTVTIDIQPQHGELNYYSLELFRYKPTVEFDGQDQFTYRICNDISCSEANVTIVVTDW